MKFRMFLPLILAACTTPQVYEHEQPAMDFISYFSGTTHGYGAIYDFRGHVTDRFYVRMEGSEGRDNQERRTIDLAEDFKYTSGKTQKRSWSVTELSPGQLTATAPDVPGMAEGVQSGNAVQFRYPITITRASGGSVTLSANDWMWAVPGATPEASPTIINRNRLSKFGIPVAELVISLGKTPSN